MNAEASSSQPKRVYMVAVIFFMLSMAPGLWMPALPNILGASDALWAVPWATAVAPVVSIFSALMFASMADRKFNSEKLLGTLAISGSFFLWLAFSSLSWGWSPWWYIGIQAITAFLSAPLFPLLTKIAFSHLADPQKQFPLYRMCGTIGWIVAGVLVSLLSFDSSPEAGRLAAYVRFSLGVMCFALPLTPPAKSSRKGMLEALGFRAFSLFRDRSLRVYFISSACISIPWAAHYMYGARFLEVMGSGAPTAQMTLGQVTEIGAMLLMSYLGVRAKVKPLVMVAMICGVARFVLYALAGETGMIAWLWLGVSLHGPCYTFLSITGQMFVDRRVPDNMRAQAQALISLLQGSLGGSVGALACGALFRQTVLNQAEQSWVTWTLFWWVLSVAVLVCLVYFSLGYRSQDEANDGLNKN